MKANFQTFYKNAVKNNFQNFKYISTVTLMHTRTNITKRRVKNVECMYELSN